MLTFTLLAALLVALALVFTLPPLLRAGSARPEVDRSRLNAAIFQERLAELAETIRDPDQLALARTELERELLREAGNDETPERDARWVGIVVALALPLLAGGMYWVTGNPDALRTQAPPQAGTMPNLDQAIGGLRAKLEQNPDNVEGWRMLARSYLSMDRYSEAASAYGQVLQRTPNPEPRLLADAAEAMGLANQGQLSGPPAKLIAQALEQQPDLPKGLWLAGMAAMQQGDYPRVKIAWEKLLTVMPAESEEAAMIRNHLQGIKDKLAQTGETPSAESTPEPSPPVASAKLSVTVQLAPNLTADPSHTLFISARAAQGPRMPLAVVRKRAGDLPVTVTLDDRQSMMPGMKISAFPAVVVTARISASGTAKSQPGDLFTESTAIPAAQWGEPLTLIIDRQVP